MVQTTIRHAFQIGDRAFVTHSRHAPIRKPCDACRGTKVIGITAAGETRPRRRKCPYCYGQGTMRDGEQRIWEVRGPATVTELQVSSSSKKSEEGKIETETRVRYSLKDAKGDGYPYHDTEPDSIFATKTEALAAAKKRNAARKEAA